jgi:MFS transporter, DHA2 family, multidrug resistance protein
MSVADIEVNAAPQPPAARLSETGKLLLFGVMAFGQFMALLDIQIVAASLNSIQAGLSAGPDEIAWVQTAYLMAEIVMIPLSGFLSQALSTRWLFALSAGLFTISSLACGMAWDINSMIFFRAIQGFVGGAMIPTVFATGFAIFSGPRLAMIPAILGMVSTLAPTLGPSLGGWITDIAGWRWLFFMNVVPGIAITVLVPILGKIDDAKPAMLKRIDWLHLAGLAVFLGALQYMLEEGPRHEWFNDTAVAGAAWLSFVGAVVFFERSFFSALPVVSLSPLRRPTFVMACVLNFVIGFGLYGATYLVPIFLGRVRDYSSLDIGTTVFVTGIFMFFGAPIAARLSTLVDQRYVIGVGFSLFALGLWLLSGVSSVWGFDELFVPQAVRGFAILLCIVPAVGLSLASVAQSELKAASGLFNLCRNLGGAVGIALVNTWLQDFTRGHILRLSEAMAASPEQAQNALAGITALISRGLADDDLAGLMARSELGRIVVREAVTLAFSDVFSLMAGLFVLALVIVPFCRGPVPGAPAPVESH